MYLERWLVRWQLDIRWSDVFVVVVGNLHFVVCAANLSCKYLGEVVKKKREH